jgi:hypothetical protein
VVARQDSDFAQHTDPGDGHLLKLRYTPLQVNVLSVEAQESPQHAIMESRDSLEGTPVVCCGLHSQVPLVAAAAKQAAPQLRIGYVMDDAAALALPFSGVLAAAVKQGLIDVTVSAGQAFGGQIEAITLHSGLLAAAHVGGCDLLISGIGPGLAGTGTPFGHGGVAQGEALNAVAALNGRPVACLRMSQADSRERHQGISHHSLIALERIAACPVTIALPAFDLLLAEPETAAFTSRIEAQLDTLDNRVGHTAFQLEDLFYSQAALRGLDIKTMGRSYGDDPLFFEAAAAAGAVGAALAVREESDPEMAAALAAEAAQAATVATADGSPPVDVLPPCVAGFDIMGRGKSDRSDRNKSDRR